MTIDLKFIKNNTTIRVQVLSHEECKHLIQIHEATNLVPINYPNNKNAAQEQRLTYKDLLEDTATCQEEYELDWRHYMIMDATYFLNNGQVIKIISYNIYNPTYEAVLFESIEEFNFAEQEQFNIHINQDAQLSYVTYSNNAKEIVSFLDNSSHQLLSRFSNNLHKTYFVKSSNLYVVVFDNDSNAILHDNITRLQEFLLILPVGY